MVDSATTATQKMMLTIVICSLLALANCDKLYIFVSEDVEAYIKDEKPAGLNKLKRDIVMECLYEMETLPFKANKEQIEAFTDDINTTKKAAGTALGFSSSDQKKYQTMVSSFAAGLLDGIDPAVGDREVIILAEQCKKPIPTRIGKLLREQHRQWVLGKNQECSG